MLVVNRRQNLLRHFVLKGLSDVFLTSKGENEALPPPSPQSNVVPLFELPIENNKHPNFEWWGGVWILLFSEVTLFEYNVSTILSPFVWWLWWMCMLVVVVEWWLSWLCCLWELRSILFTSSGFFLVCCL